MNPSWYLVKTNWPAIRQVHPDYAGIGGDAWPLSHSDSLEAREAHSAMQAAREQIKVGGFYEALCLDSGIATTYFDLASRYYPELWLLQVTRAIKGQSCDGYDIGMPSGGYSAVESELILLEAAEPALNDLGLFPSSEAAREYFKAREGNDKLEHLDGMAILAIKVLRRC